MKKIRLLPLFLFALLSCKTPISSPASAVSSLPASSSLPVSEKVSSEEASSLSSSVSASASSASDSFSEKDCRKVTVTFRDTLTESDGTQYDLQSSKADGPALLKAYFDAIDSTLFSSLSGLSKLQSCSYDASDSTKHVLQVGSSKATGGFTLTLSSSVKALSLTGQDYYKNYQVTNWNNDQSKTVVNEVAKEFTHVEKKASDPETFLFEFAEATKTVSFASSSPSDGSTANCRFFLDSLTFYVVK